MATAAANNDCEVENAFCQLHYSDNPVLNSIYRTTCEIWQSRKMGDIEFRKKLWAR